MSKRPRTITAEREAYLRKGHWSALAHEQLLAELDAERAAHDSSEQTIRELRDKLNGPCELCAAALAQHAAMRKPE